MPDRPVTVAAYAAGASLAAITFFYVFGPTFFIDGENSSNSSGGRKRGIIGLSNTANDCFINSVLQALAGLGDLRLYLIRELHRRELDGLEIYETVPEEQDGKKIDRPEKVRELQQGSITRAIKEMLDALNERPIYKKTISARPLIEALEKAFRTRISRNQQDAQEFLQVVAERLCDEYHSAVNARKRAAAILDAKTEETQELSRETSDERIEAQQSSPDIVLEDGTELRLDEKTKAALLLTDDGGFPFEGKIESQIQCQFCRFKNKPSRSNFVSLTLNVPQKSSTTLDYCFDILLKTEEIGGFKCDKCRLKHALEFKADAMKKAKSEKETASIEQDIELIQKALEEDPEMPPEGVELPPLDKAPKRSIKKYMRLTSFPRLLAIHLSRSIFDPRSVSLKNAAKVSFPERLRLGGILDEKWYKLLGIVCHKGSHNSGHYESFRRNHLYPPFATPDVFSAYAAQSKNGSKVASPIPSPKIPAMARVSDVGSRPSTGSETSHIISTPSISSSSLSSPSTSRPTSKHFLDPAIRSTPRDSPSPDQSKLSWRPRSAKLETSTSKSVTSSGKDDTSEKPRFRRKRKSNDRWWRISDDKIKECKTSDVLAMQKEVYLLFYELERPGDDAMS
jgi:ubiquitin carboxyl-terminal hydrolase 16